MEPTYEYIKGQGWVVTTIPFLTFTALGKRWMVVARKPEYGELCCWAGIYNGFYNPDGKPNLRNWVAYAGDYPERLSVWDKLIESGLEARAEKVIFVTFIPLSE